MLDIGFQLALCRVVGAQGAQGGQAADLHQVAVVQGRGEVGVAGNDLSDEAFAAQELRGQVHGKRLPWHTGGINLLQGVSTASSRCGGVVISSAPKPSSIMSSGSAVNCPGASEGTSTGLPGAYCNCG